MKRGVSLPGLAKATLTLLVVFLVLASQAVAFSSYDSLNGIASRLAERKVTIRCLTTRETEFDPTLAWGAEAYVKGWVDPTGRWHPGSYAVFRTGHCENLLAVMAGDLSGKTLYNVTWSVLALVHEAGHLRGKAWAGSEAKTQCWAMQHIRAALNMLGVRDLEAQRLVVWQAIQIHKFDLSTEYQEPGCLLPTP